MKKKIQRDSHRVVQVVREEDVRMHAVRVDDTIRKYNSRRQGGDVAKGKAKKAKPAKVWAPKGSAAAAEEKKTAKKKYPNYNKYKKANDDAPKVQKYSTKKGIYARKAVAAN